MISAKIRFNTDLQLIHAVFMRNNDDDDSDNDNDDDDDDNIACLICPMSAATMRVPVVCRQSAVRKAATVPWQGEVISVWL